MSLWQTLRGKPAAGGGGKRAAAMQRIQWVLGVATTIIVATVWANGALDKFERDSIDLRAKHFPSTNAQPSDRIAIVAIDDAAIENVGRWPWDREKLAVVIDELATAGAAVVAMDLLLDDPQPPRPVQKTAPDGSPAGFDLVLDDDILAAAMRRHGRVISAVSFKFKKEDATTDSTVLKASMPQLYDLLAASPAMLQQPWEEVFDTVRASLPGFREGRESRGKEFDKLHLRWDAARTVLQRQADSSYPLGDPQVPWAVSIEPGVPVAPVAAASRRIANVTFDSYDPDGLTRRIPLVVRHNERLWPTLGLAAAMEYHNARASALGTQSKLQIAQDGVSLVEPDGTAQSLAAFTERVDATRVAGLHLVSWPRGVSGDDIPITDWKRQFYNKRHEPTIEPEAEISIGRLYEPYRVSVTIRDNVSMLGTKVAPVYKELGVFDGDRAAEWSAVEQPLLKEPIGSPTWASALDRAGALFAAAGRSAQDLLDAILGGEPEEKLSPQDRAVVKTLGDAKRSSAAALDSIRKGSQELEDVRVGLHRQLSGKVCFVGWTATGSLADFVATSIHPRTPGVHVHAAVCNSALTGFQRVPGPLGGQLMIIAAMGLMGTWVGVRSSVVAGPLLVVAVVLLWAIFASAALWALYDRIWSIAGPAVAASAGWLIVVLHRLLVEQRSRRKTEERFKSYVSPAVVDILVQNPSLSSMAPQQKELTVLFSDIAGFTTTAERLGSQATAELLATYLGTMTDVVQRNSATLDKYIGDAIMAFWGAPIDDAQHARHACQAAVEMMQTLDRLNQDHAFGGAGSLHVRIGLATGDVMVGDFGNPPRNSSYTVIGDTVNFGSRLEGANKVFGTRTLVSDRTRQLAGDGFLWRTVGVLKVKGKHSGVVVHELLPGPIKGDQTDAWIALTDALIADYRAERFEAALQKAVQMREMYHDEGFASAYGEAIAALQAGLIEDGFDGSITLTEK